MHSIPSDETATALKNYEVNGSDLTKPMEIDFFIAINSQAEGDLVSFKVQALGFKASVEQDIETSQWTCYCTKTIIPEYFKVSRIENLLDTIARAHGGYYDGFGSYGNAT